jgi:hypothetical protein
MLAKWTGEVKGTMHIYEVSMQELADKLGISTTFLSALLHCRRSTKDAEFRIRNALMDIVKSRESIE